MKKFFKEDVEGAVVYSEDQPTPSGDGHSFVEITNSEEIKSLVKSLYKERTIDGIDFFEGFRADIVLLYSSGVKTALEVYEIEEKMNRVIVKVIRGDWLTASNEITTVIAGGALDQDFINEVQTGINLYISENY
jgi:hypothetical protein